MESPTYSFKQHIIYKATMLRFLALSIIIISLHLAASAKPDGPASDFDALAPALKAAIEGMPAKIKQRQQYIDSLRRLSYSSENASVRQLNMKRLAGVLSTFNIDSLIKDLDRAISHPDKFSDPAFQQWLRLDRLGYLPMKGEVRQALASLADEYSSGIYPENQCAVYSSAARLYFSALQLVKHNSPVADHYRDKGLAYLDSLIGCHSANSPVTELLMGFRDLVNKEYDTAMNHINETLRNPRTSKELESNAALFAGIIAGKRKNYESQQYYFALSSLTDMNECFLTGAALTSLAFSVLEHSSKDDSLELLQNALKYNHAAGDVGRARIHNYDLLQLIESQQRFASKKKRQNIIIAILTIASVSALLAFSLRQRQQLDNMNTRIKEYAAANTAKEEAMGTFVDISTSFQEQFDDFARMARRKISSGQVEDLYAITKSRRFSDRYDERAFSMFDSGFIRAFPGFVNSVNSLLVPDKQILPPSDNELTPELRVLALARLGIEESSTIARFLGLSLNTIYTYRNKFRSRAISRETFDADVMKIGKVI